MQANADLLKSQLNTWIHQSTPQNGVKAIITPHAGYHYSGKTAGYSFSALAGEKPALIVILGPSHYLSLNNRCGLTPFSAFETPLGNLQVEEKLNAHLQLNYPGIFIELSQEEDEQEHSLEMQFPFLKHIHPDCPVLPIMIGNLDDETRKQVSSALHSILPQSVVLVLSGDFCHYGPRFGFTPTFPSSISDGIREMDLRGFEAIKGNSVNEFKKYLQSTGNTICGRQVFLLFMQFNEDSNGIWTLLSYAQSDSVSEATNSSNPSPTTPPKFMSCLSTEISATISHLNGLLQSLADLPVGQESQIPLQLNAFVDHMKRTEEAASSSERDPMIPIDLIESTCAQPIEEAIGNDLRELDRATSELRTLKSHHREQFEELIKD